MLFQTLAIALSLLVEPGPVTGGFESLKGFNTAAISQINRVVGSENLPLAMGLPVEPGVYVAISPERISIFDKNVATVSNGAVNDPQAAEFDSGKFGDGVGGECKSGCSRLVFDAFHATWRSLVNESRTLGVDMPVRVLLAANASLPARLLVDTAYAATESRPVGPPQLYLLLNGGQAGLRSRPFSILPPDGLLLSPGQRALALTITMEASGGYVVTAADPRFGRTLTYASREELRAALKDIKKRYPSKESIIIDVRKAGTVDDVVQVMVLAQDDFPNVVLSTGQPVRVG